MERYGMIRHISIFAVNDRKTDVPVLLDMLLAVQRDCPLACGGMVAPSAQVTPPLLDVDEGPVFGDVIQVLDFPDQDAAAGYPSCEAHLELLKKSPPMIRQVTAIDFYLPGVR